MSTSQGVIFLKKKNVNGESKWFEDGDEENDGKYVGKIENGKPNGHGTLTSPDGDKYEGEWVNGRRHGKNGTYTWSNRVGTWQNNKNYLKDFIKAEPDCWTNRWCKEDDGRTSLLP